MRLVPGVDGELPHPLALAARAGHEVDARERPAALGDRAGELAQRLAPRVELDAHGDGELGGDAGHRAAKHTNRSKSARIERTLHVMAKRGPLRSTLAIGLLAAAVTPATATAEFEFQTEWGTPKNGEVVLPTDVDQDNSGNTYVVDPLSRSVQKFDSANNPLLRWGSFGNGPGEFGFPMSIGVNAATGEVYVGDVYGVIGLPGSPAVRIERFDSNGTFLGQFGSLGSGEGQFGGVSGIAVDPATGRVFVAEAHRVQRFSATGQFERMWGKDVDPAGGTGAETCTVGCKAALTGTAEGEFSVPDRYCDDRRQRLRHRGHQQAGAAFRRERQLPDHGRPRRRSRGRHRLRDVHGELQGRDREARVSVSSTSRGG